MEKNRRVAVVTANLGRFDREVDPVPQALPSGWEMQFIRYTDANFPPREKAMRPRLQARIPKCFAWQMAPGFDAYIWVDSSCALRHSQSVAWFLDYLRNADIAVMRHPDRRTIKDEYEFIKRKLAEGNDYLTNRYKGELLDEQYAEIACDRDYPDDMLFASTAFAYWSLGRPSRPYGCGAVRWMLKEWWYHISRFHTVDQLALPYVLRRSDCSYRVIEESYLKTPYITYVRNVRE